MVGGIVSTVDVGGGTVVGGGPVVDDVGGGSVVGGGAVVGVVVAGGGAGGGAAVAGAGVGVLRGAVVATNGCVIATPPLPPPPAVVDVGSTVDDGRVLEPFEVVVAGNAVVVVTRTVGEGDWLASCCLGDVSLPVTTSYSSAAIATDARA